MLCCVAGEAVEGGVGGEGVAPGHDEEEGGLSGGEEWGQDGGVEGEGRVGGQEQEDGEDERTTQGSAGRLQGQSASQ